MVRGKPLPARVVPLPFVPHRYAPLKGTSMAKPADAATPRTMNGCALDGDIATVGITDHAQEQLGDVVFVELPEIGRDVAAGEACAVVESVKAASDVYAPLAGKVVEINADHHRRPVAREQRRRGRRLVLPLELDDPARSTR